MDMYHVMNRGVEKRKVFIDQYDYLRFVQNLYMLNNRARLLSTTRKRGGIRSKNVFATEIQRTQLVHIHAFALMPNHYHLLLSPIGDDQKSLSAFMQKLNMAYAKYFNEKYDRSGYLWQGSYRAIRVHNNAHLMYLPYYIHLNPLDIKYKSWRAGRLTCAEDALRYLDTYRWSSYLDYTGQKNFPSLLRKDELTPLLGDKKSQLRDIRAFVTHSRTFPDGILFE